MKKITLNKKTALILCKALVAVLAVILLVLAFKQLVPHAFIKLTPKTESNVSEQLEQKEKNGESDPAASEANGELSGQALEQTQPEAEPEPEKVYRNISFAAVGDILVHTNVYKYAAQLAEGTDAEYNFVPMFENIKGIMSQVDIAFANQETLCAGKERGYSGYPCFNTPDEISQAVLETGFDIVNIANNHMLDKGEKGLARAIEFWKTKPITLLGGYTSREDYDNIRIYEQEGVKIAFLAYTYSTNGLVLPSSSSLVVPYESFDEIDRQTKLARDMADIVIVAMHWGYEDNFLPSENQKRLAEMMAANNVDVIVGSHPHVLQPIEWLERTDGKQMLVAYSIGNLISTMMYGRNMLGGIIKFEINETDEGFDIINPELIPTVTYYKSGFSQPTIYLYRDFTEEMANNHGCRRYDSYMSKSYLDGILKKTISHDFIKDSHYDALYGITDSQLTAVTE